MISETKATLSTREDSPNKVASNSAFMEKLYRVLTDLETEINNKEHMDPSPPIIVDPSLDRTYPTFLEKILNKRNR